MRFRVVLFIILWGIFSFPVFASTPPDSSSLLKVYEDSMKSLQYVRISSQHSDKEKEAANIKFTLLMNKALSLPGSYDYPFDSLVTIGRLSSPDKQFRIINWNVPESGGKESYMGYIQSYNLKKKKYDLYVLKDKTSEITNPQTTVCNAEKWLGMVYFTVIQEKGKDKTYILLGKQFYTKLVNRKVIEVLTFNHDGVPSFGKSIFNKLPSTFKAGAKRVVFEYSAQIYMSLRYDDSKKMILFDHLGPTSPELEGQHQYYGPSFQVDGLAYKNGSWSYVENVDARNPEEKSDKLFNDPLKHSYEKGQQPIYKTN